MTKDNTTPKDKAIIITSCILCGLLFIYAIYRSLEQVIRKEYEPELIEELNNPAKKKIEKTEKEIIQITEELKREVYEASKENDSAVISRFYQLAGGSTNTSSTGE